MPEVYLVKLYKDESPKIYKFKLPNSVNEGQTGTGTYYDEGQEKLVVPKENQGTVLVKA